MPGAPRERMVAAGAPLNAGQTRTLPSHLRYARLSADLPEPEKRTPSLLAAELKGSVQQPVALKRPEVIELLNMSEFTHNTESIVPLDEPLFQPTPPEVVYESFVPLQKYTAQLSLRNNDNVNRRIKIIQPDSSVFSIEPPKVLKGAGGGKVAPGMEVVFKARRRVSRAPAGELAARAARQRPPEGPRPLAGRFGRAFREPEPRGARGATLTGAFSLASSCTGALCAEGRAGLPLPAGVHHGAREVRRRCFGARAARVLRLPRRRRLWPAAGAPAPGGTGLGRGRGAVPCLRRACGTPLSRPLLELYRGCS